MEALEPYADLPLDPARIVELAEADIEQDRVAPAPRPEVARSPGTVPDGDEKGAEGRAGPSGDVDADASVDVSPEDMASFVEAAERLSPDPDPDESEQRGTAGAIRRSADSIDRSFEKTREQASEEERELGRLILNLIPGIGELLSAEEAAKGFSEARRLERDGKLDEARAADDKASLAAIGAVPVIGRLTKVPAVATAFWKFFDRYRDAKRTFSGSMESTAGASGRASVPAAANTAFSVGNTTNDSVNDPPPNDEEDNGGGPSDEKRSGKKARDSSKNERHGDGGRALQNLETDESFEREEAEARKLPRKQRKRALKKIERRKRMAHRRKRGEEHRRRNRK